MKKFAEFGVYANRYSVVFGMSASAIPYAQNNVSVAPPLGQLVWEISINNENCVGEAFRLPHKTEYKFNGGRGDPSPTAINERNFTVGAAISRQQTERYQHGRIISTPTKSQP